MSAGALMTQTTETTPGPRVRVAGAFYLVNMVGCTFAEAFVRQRLVVQGDAAATAGNILTHEFVFRLGFAADLIGVAAYVAVTLLLFELFRPVNRVGSLLAACFSLIGCGIQIANLLNHFAPLVFLSGEGYLAAFKSDQLQALAYLSLRLQSIGYDVSLVCFGLYCFLIGYLVIRSGFLPRTLGALLILAGLCYLTNSFGNFLLPSFAAHLFPYILVPCVIAEGGLTFWLLVPGVNVRRWRERTSDAGKSMPP